MANRETSDKNDGNFHGGVVQLEGMTGRVAPIQRVYDKSGELNIASEKDAPARERGTSALRTDSRMIQSLHR